MNNNTEILFILDKSGSMEKIKDDAIGGYNSFINEQKKLGENANVSLVLFSDKIEVIDNGVNISKATILNNDNYKPSGWTALLDAIGITMDNYIERIEKLSKEERPLKTIFVIVTDGQENSSHKFNKESINRLIKHHTIHGDWEFLFLGANIDTFAEANSIGVSNSRSMSFDCTAKGLNTMYDSLSNAVTSYRSVGVVNDNWNLNNEVVK